MQILNPLRAIFCFFLGEKRGRKNRIFFVTWFFSTDEGGQAGRKICIMNDIQEGEGYTLDIYTSHDATGKKGTKWLKSRHPELFCF